MSKPVGWSWLGLALCLFGPVTPAVAVPSISIGTVNLDPDKAGQVVEINVTGGDQVEAVSLNLSVANGGPELEPLGELPAGTGIRGPKITAVDLLTDTIFAGNNNGQVDALAGMNLTQLVSVNTITASGTVSAAGLLARVTFDTTGFTSGSFTLSLTAVGMPTDFAGIPANLTDGTIVVGTPSTTPPIAGSAAPIVDAGADRNVDNGATVTLAASASDSTGAALTFAWKQIGGPPVVLSGANSATAQFTAPTGVINTKLTFQLTASDGTNTVSDTVTITVNANAQSFSVSAGAAQSVANGAAVQLAGAVTNPGNLNLALDWLQVRGLAIALTGGTTANAGFLAPAGVANTVLTLQFEASDGTNVAADTVDITVNADNTAPVADAGLDRAVAAGASVQLDGSGTDPAGTGLTFLWTQIAGAAVTLSSSTVANPTLVAPSAATASDLEFEFRVTSGSATSIATVVVHVAAAPAGTSQTPTTTGGSSTTSTQQNTGTTTSSSSTSGSQSSSVFTPEAALVFIALAVFAMFLLWWLWV